MVCLFTSKLLGQYQISQLGDTHSCKQLVQGYYSAVPGQDSNPQPTGHISDPLPSVSSCHLPVLLFLSAQGFTDGKKAGRLGNFFLETISELRKAKNVKFGIQQKMPVSFHSHGGATYMHKQCIHGATVRVDSPHAAQH